MALKKRRRKRIFMPEEATPLFPDRVFLSAEYDPDLDRRHLLVWEDLDSSGAEHALDGLVAVYKLAGVYRAAKKIVLEERADNPSAAVVSERSIVLDGKKVPPK